MCYPNLANINNPTAKQASTFTAQGRVSVTSAGTLDLNQQSLFPVTAFYNGVAQLGSTTGLNSLPLTR